MKVNETARVCKISGRRTRGYQEKNPLQNSAHLEEQSGARRLAQGTPPHQGRVKQILPPVHNIKKGIWNLFLIL